MKYSLAILFFLSFPVKGDVDEGVKLISFVELFRLGKQMGDDQIAMRGYLLNDDGELYFCSNMESCYSRGKERVRIIADSKINDYLIGVSDCHMELTGTYHGLKEEQRSWPLIGYFEVTEAPGFDFNSNYQSINDRCVAYNRMNN